MFARLSVVIAAVLLGQSVFAAGFSGVIACSEKGNPKDEALVRIEDGKIVPWSKKGMVKAKAKDDSTFFLLTLNEDTGLEYSKIIGAKNGYSLVIVGTTADEMTLGISPDLTSGFLKYKDNGSGNGNSQYEIVCSAK